MAKKAFVLMIVFAQVAAQADVALRAPGVSSTSFKGVVAARDDLAPFESVLPSDLPQAKSQLNRSLERAQRSYLSGSLEAAKADFHGILEMAHRADWPAAQRRVILYAALRSAQLAKDEPEMQAFLEKAAVYAPDLRADSSLFPPPLLHRYEGVRKDMMARALEVRVKDRFEGFETIKINGRLFRVDETESIRVPPGQHRVSLRSDAFLPVTEVMTASQLMVYRAPQVPVAGGSCDRPSLQRSLDVSPVVVVYAPDCLQKFHLGIWQRLPLETQHGITSASLKPLPEVQALPLGSDELPQKPLYRKTWFWTGVVSALAASAVVIAKQREARSGTREVAPSHQEGF